MIKHSLRPGVTGLRTRLTNILPIDEAPFLDLGRGLRSRYGLVPVNNVILNPHNARSHSKKQIRKVARSMEVNGALAPAIVHENLMLLAGQARLAACQANGTTDLPVVQVFGMSEAQKRAFLLADNRIAEDGGWDREKLAAQIPELTFLFEEAELTIEDTGFDRGNR